MKENINVNENSNIQNQQDYHNIGRQGNNIEKSQQDYNDGVHQWDTTPYIDFDEIKQKFIKADVDEKITIYTTTSGLSVEQFKELLQVFPLQHLDKLERAMEQ